MSLDSDITRAQHAQRLLDDTLLNQILDGLVAGAREEFEETADNEAEKRELIWSRLKSLKLVREALKKAISDGKVAENQKAWQAKQPPKQG